MTSYQIKKLTMFLSLQNFIGTTAPEIIAAMPNFNEFFDKFKDYVNVLLQQSVIQNQPISGYRELKVAQQNDMIDQALAIATSVYAYAEVTNNITLKAASNYTKTALTRLPEITCIDACKNIYKVAIENLPALAPYNVTGETLEKLNTAITDFSYIYPIPKEHITIKKMATKDIKTYFTDATTQTDKMTSLVKMIVTTQPEFTQLYFLTKKIEKPAHTTLSLKANVSDNNKNPLAKVQVTSLQITFTKPKFTSKLGNFQLKNLASNVYTFTFSKAGYITQTQQVPITSGERTELKIILEPNP